MPDAPKLNVAGGFLSYIPNSAENNCDWLFLLTINLLTLCATIFIDLENYGFGDRSLFEGFVATVGEQGDIIGYTTYYFTFSTWQGKTLFMEDMYILKQHRKHAIALSFYHLISQVKIISLGYSYSSLSTHLKSNSFSFTIWHVGIASCSGTMQGNQHDCS